MFMSRDQKDEGKDETANRMRFCPAKPCRLCIPLVFRGAGNEGIRRRKFKLRGVSRNQAESFLSKRDWRSLIAVLCYCTKLHLSESKKGIERGKEGEGIEVREGMLQTHTHRPPFFRWEKREDWISPLLFLQNRKREEESERRNANTFGPRKGNWIARVKSLSFFLFQRITSKGESSNIIFYTGMRFCKRLSGEFLSFLVDTHWCRCSPEKNIGKFAKRIIVIVSVSANVRPILKTQPFPHVSNVFFLPLPSPPCGHYWM